MPGMLHLQPVSYGIFLEAVCLFLADRTNGRAIGTVLRLSSVCDVLYCG